MDFVHDRTKQGGKLKFLTVIDEGCRECLEIRAERKMTGRDVLETLDELIREYGRPEFIRTDNGSEFIAKELRKWLVLATSLIQAIISRKYCILLLLNYHSF